MTKQFYSFSKFLVRYSTAQQRNTFKVGNTRVISELNITDIINKRFWGWILVPCVQKIISSTAKSEKSVPVANSTVNIRDRMLIELFCSIFNYCFDFSTVFQRDHWRRVGTFTFVWALSLVSFFFFSPRLLCAVAVLQCCALWMPQRNVSIKV